MYNFKDMVANYAKLAVEVGVNIQKGQTLVVNAPIESAEFVRLVAQHAYDMGAKNVHVEWNDEKLGLIKYTSAPDEAFKEFPMWKANGLEEMAKEGAAFLTIYAQDPELLKDVDPERISTAAKTRSQALKAYRDYIMASRVSWSIVSIPTAGWARKVFSGMSQDEAIAKLWESIFKIVRIDSEDPVAEWKKHLENLGEKVEFLNAKKFKKLHFKSSVTDLHVELPKGHIWAGGGEFNPDGVYFVANMPTEEIFTMPLKTGVNGHVKSTKPLNYGGNLIDDFELTFKDGKVVDFTASKGYEILKKLIETDEGSCYLGEVALVPYDSPISNMDTVFFNTLFDENASCHLAFGMAYPTCVEGGDSMSEQELEKAGANKSLVHEDFMIGSSDMDITGETESGETVPVFKNGNWAF